jgi:CRISPR-associated protein Csm5
MNYRLEVLTPTLVGDGAALAPIDYMVWKDQVNVLDQKRIFRLLAKGSRLDSYLTQVKRAEKLDFASWGGFAQNYAGRRIPFEHAGYTAYWERLRAEDCFIPTFAAGTAGPYLPGSALKGALRTALVASVADEKALEAAKGQRRPGEALEVRALHRERAGGDIMKSLGIGDSPAVPTSSFRVYMLRTATLVEMRPPQQGLGLGWRQAGRGSVDSRRIEDSFPTFAEMAQPGTVFEGAWDEKPFYKQTDILRALHWKSPATREKILAAANAYAAKALAAHRQFATMTGLTPLLRTLDQLDAALAAASAQGDSCLVTLGWATGLLAKSAWLPSSEDQNYRSLMAELPDYARAIRTGLPFPKTRQIVFAGNQPSALPGWCSLTAS